MKQLAVHAKSTHAQGTLGPYSNPAITDALAGAAKLLRAFQRMGEEPFVSYGSPGPPPAAQQDRPHASDHQSVEDISERRPGPHGGRPHHRAGAVRAAGA